MADTIYLDLNSGNDGNDGLTIGSPKLTLSNANATVDDGGTIILLDGTYILSANVTTALTRGVTITSQSGDPSSCIIDGAGSYYYEIIVKDTATTILSYIKFNNLDIVWREQVLNLEGKSNVDVTVLGCVFSNNSLGIFNSVILGTYSGSGSNSTLTVDRCLFYENSGSTATPLIGLGTFASNTINLYNNVQYNQTVSSGMFVAVDGNVVNIKNNIIYNAFEIAFKVVKQVSAGTVNIYNTCYHSAGSGTVDLISSGAVDIDSNNITDDPLFVDLPNLDFRLRPSSPCVDTGTIL